MLLLLTLELPLLLLMLLVVPMPLLLFFGVIEPAELLLSFAASIAAFFSRAFWHGITPTRGALLGGAGDTLSCLGGGVCCRCCCCKGKGPLLEVL